VDERQIPKTGRSRASSTLTSVGVVLAAAALVVAGFLVVTNFRRVKPESLPPSLRITPPDTGLVVFRASMRRKVSNLSARCEAKRKQLGNRTSSLSDSLSRECDSSISSVLGRIAALDTIRRENRKAAADSIRAGYERARITVRAFARTVLDSDTLDEDSLDRELKKLISE
jgi:hypothetical protein